MAVVPPESDSPSARAPAWFRRDLALLVVGLCVLYLPFLGSFTLWDPWEGHYAEVARRMLAEHDFLYMRWQAENFFSKPPLAMWLMAASMRLHGIGADGGYSGEFVSSAWVEWSIRLPFSLLAIAGVTALWFALARIWGRRPAWLAALILATTPYYGLISRQAITDMPMCALLVISASLFLLFLFHPAPVQTNRPRSFWVFAAAFVLLAVGQLVWFSFDLADTRLRLGSRYLPGPVLLLPFFGACAAVLTWCARTTRSSAQVYMYWFYLLCGVAVLGKGPLAPALLGLIILTYLVVTWEWRLLARVELARGVSIALLMALPWHFAMGLKEGPKWTREYLNQHLFARAFQGVHGDRGTFQYFFEQLGIGMWPWVALLPVALAAVLFRRPGTTAVDRVRLIFGIWAIVGFFFFSLVETKFHHYILPAVPGLAVLVAGWLDDLLAGRVKYARAALVATMGVLLMTSIDLVAAQQKLMQLFIYRYDRTIPRGAPFFIDYTGTLLVFAGVVAVVFALLFVPRLRRIAPWLLGAVTCAFTFFTLDVLMVAAAPHYGQRDLFRQYYAQRNVHGVLATYAGTREFVRDFGGAKPLLRIRTFVPDTLSVGSPMKVSLRLAGEEATLAGSVDGVDRARNLVTVTVNDPLPPAFASLLEVGRKRPDPPRAQRMVLDADELLATLYWRGEAFYSGGELWNPKDTREQRVFHEFNDSDQKRLKDYIARHTGVGRTFWLISEVGRLDRIKPLLPVASQKTHQRATPTSSFFGLATFEL